jgi:hypothetical protein
MPPFICIICNYSTARKNDFLKHHKTKKHIQNQALLEENKVSCEKKSQMTQNDPEMTQNDPERPKCSFCQKSFSSLAHQRRHEIHRCIKNPAINVDNKEQIKKLKREFNKQKKEMMKQFELLLNKVGNTTNNNITNNTININNYGSEDVSHLSHEYKISLLKIPFGMLQKLIKEIHFNKHKPENKNIYISNQRDNKVQIFENGEWKYEKKKIAIRNLIDRKYYLMDDFFNEVENSGDLNEFHKTNYKEFARLYEEEENKQLISSLSEDAEIIILNNQK